MPQIEALGLQTLVFDSTKFTIETARRWCQVNEFRDEVVESDTEPVFLAHQASQSNFAAGTFRTREIEDGVEGIFGRRLGGGELVVHAERKRFRCPECGEEWEYGTAKDGWTYKPAGEAAVFAGRPLEGVEKDAEYAWHTHLRDAAKMKGTLVRANRIEVPEE